MVSKHPGEMQLASLDWIILALYFVALIGLSFWIGKRQKRGEDYFLGGRKIRGGVVALSLAANQVSAISLIGAPAFVALRAGGGLRWLQYEFAVPLAMIAINSPLSAAPSAILFSVRSHILG